MPQWTPKQQDVINTRDRNILVSAAAGSGKTAVLVARIIKLLTDEENPMDINQLLVVTFTKAAASEMKERVRDALERLIERNPDNHHIQKQLNMMNTAKITTIDSFCASVVKENFEKVDLDPDFRIGDEAEIALMKADVMEKMLSEYYEKADEDFIEFIEQYSATKTDNHVIQLIEELYRASESHENPEKWVAACADNYSAATMEEIEETMWMKRNVENTRNKIADLCRQLEKLMDVCRQQDGPVNYWSVISEAKEALLHISTKKTYTALKNSMEAFKMAALPRKSGALDKEKEEYVKKNKTKISGACTAIIKEFLPYTEAEILEEMEGVGKQIAIAIHLTLDFMARLKEEKLEKGIMDFSDQEHYALQILTREDAKGNLVRSDIAENMSKQYREIMIDEYQDSNVVQEAILTSISGGSGINNIFMVGDVKQSIYRFRLANPNLFLEKYDTYSDNPQDAEYKIVLDKNFRSRQEVIDSVNYIFDTIMCRHTGGIEYIDNNRLVCGADYCRVPENQDNSMEVIVVDGDRELEMEQIAKRIRQIVNPKTGMMVQGDDGNLRLAKYSDIVILLRGVKGISNRYVEILEKYGIPVFTETKTGFYDAQEVMTVLNFLNIIDNPRQDIPLAGILLSPIFQFTENELAEIRINDEQEELYDALKAYVYDGDDKRLTDKINAFLYRLDGLRDKIPYVTVYEMIDEILSISGYENYIRTLPSGIRRIRNIEMLKEKAVSYEKTSYSGLFHFVRYIEKVKVTQEEGEALSVDESDNIVRIMSIHKSKGLQFPIVFLANAASQFRAERDAIAIHEKYGIGMDYVNHELRIKRKSLIKNIIRTEINRENKAELLRLLYVALTRAQEKLIIIGAVNKMDKLIENIAVYRENTQLQANNTEIMEANNFMQWIFLALARNKAADNIDALVAEKESGNEELYNKNSRIITKLVGKEEEEALLEDYIDVMKEKSDKEKLLSIHKGQVFDEVTRNIIANNLHWQYPYIEDVNISTKASVTEIKRQALHEYDEQQDGMELFQETVPDIIPDFAKSDEQLHEKLTGANRGTAYHRIFELMDFHLTEYTKETVAEMIYELLQSGFIDQQTADVVDAEDIIKFTKTDLFRRMKAADKRGELFREQKFLLGRKACEINHKTESEELVIIQGIIDACFIENGKYYVVDYKTDQVKQVETLYDKYCVQLDYYRKAIEQITEKTVGDEIIYSVTLGQELSFNSQRKKEGDIK